MANRSARSKADLSSEFTLDELSVELKDASSQASTQIRTINIGVLALVWTLLLKGEDVQILVGKIPAKSLLAVALFCILSVVADLCQYLAAEYAADSTFDRAVVAGTKTAGYNPDSFSYRAIAWFYRTKLTLTALAATAFIVLVAIALFE